MTGPYCLDEDLIRRLPLPLAQLYRRAHNSNGAHNRHQAAYFLWEAALKLLASAALAEYAALGRPPDPSLVERLGNLARPAVGHWWEFVRLLVPPLAEGGDEPFGKARDLVLGHGRDDLPRAAGLDAALREALDGAAGSRSTVRLSELFDRLVRYRNRELGHGALGLRPAEFYERMGGALLAGVAEVLGRLDVLAGRRLLYVGEVRQAGGVWSAPRFDLVGETARGGAPLEWPRAGPAGVPDGDRLYLEGPTRALRPLHPLLLYEAETAEVFFLNARRGQRRTEYLSYATGRFVERKDLAGEQQSLLGRVLGVPVDAGQVGQWAGRAEADEEKALPPAPEAAPRLVGEFEVFSELGRGGMGVVYRAWQPSLGRQVALKKLLRAGDARAEARFRREIKALGRVEHPNLVKVFTSGSEGEDWFYAMELVEGADLGGVCERLAGSNASTLGDAEWRRAVTTACEEARKKERPLADEGRSPPAPAHPAAAPPSPAPPAARGREYVTQVVGVVRQAAEAAHALHEAGVVHRDVKPGNILLTPDGSHAVLTDLGLAQLADEMDGKLTRTREFVGTLRYASPEQVLAAAPVDRRSDVYSLGATLWELLTLRPMYGATEQTAPAELMQRIQCEEAGGARAHNPRVSRDLEAVVQKCLEKDPKRRYATARELADDLGRFLAGEPVRARPVGRVRRLLRRARRRPGVALAVLLAAVALPALAAFGYWYWDTHARVRVEYYASFESRRWSPVGIERLTEEEARHRHLSWKFTRRGGRVEKIEAVNGSGFPAPTNPAGAFITRSDEPRRECGFEWRRNDRGEPIEEIARDQAGTVVWVFHLGTPTTGYYSDESGIPRARGGGGAAFVNFTYTEEGYVREVRFLDKDGKPQADADGVFLRRREYDARGLLVGEDVRDADGNPALAGGYFASWKATYDGRANRVALRYFDREGRPVRTKDGFASLADRYDEHGNVVEEAYFDEAGQPVACVSGYARVTVEVDDRGNQVGMAFFDGAGKPARNSGGVARWTARFDGKGNLIDTAAFDGEGRPTWFKEGSHRWTGRYDDRNNRVETAYFDGEGRPVRIGDGYARVKSTYDEKNNKVAVAYFDPEGRPTRGKDGDAGWTGKYDGRGNKTEETYVDEGGLPLRVKGGYARVAWEYDEHGNATREAYFDEAGQPTRGKGGYAAWTAKYDGRGNRVECAYFDPEGRATRGKGGFAAWTAKYDERGNKVEGAFFDEEGRPVRATEGHAVWRAKYDERGNRVEGAFFDEKGQPARNGEGCALWTAKYDERGNRVEGAMFDGKGQPMRGYEGYAAWRGKYDEHDNQAEGTYFDEAGGPARNKDGCFRWTAKYDERGNRVEGAFFDERGQPMRGTEGYAAWASKYDDRGNEVEEAYFDEGGQPVEGRAADGRPVWARWVARYDDRDRPIERHFYDRTGQELSSRVIIKDVAPGGRGQRLGLAPGDFLLTYDGQEVTDYVLFISRRNQESRDGKPRELVVLRGKQRLTFPVSPGLLGVVLENRLSPKEK
jgi:YD repeat-containing protein